MLRNAIIYRYQNPRFSSGQLRTLADISTSIGQVVLAGTVIPFVVPSVDSTRLFVVTSGLVASLFFWTISLLVSRKAS